MPVLHHIQFFLAELKQACRLLCILFRCPNVCCLVPRRSIHLGMFKSFRSYRKANKCSVTFQTGGQDDLLTIFSPWEQRVIARCQGHSSFVSAVAFDELRCDGRTYRFGSVAEDNKLILASLPSSERLSSISHFFSQWDFSSGALHRPKFQVSISSCIFLHIFPHYRLGFAPSAHVNVLHHIARFPARSFSAVSSFSHFPRNGWSSLPTLSPRPFSQWNCFRPTCPCELRNHSIIDVLDQNRYPS